MLPTQTYANEVIGTDIRPWEVVNVVGEKTVEVRSMHFKQLDWDRKWKVGGFAGHLSNQHEQKWEIYSDPEGAIVRIRLHKDGYWRCRDGRRFLLADEPKRFYDFNF